MKRKLSTLLAIFLIVLIIGNFPQVYAFEGHSDSEIHEHNLNDNTPCFTVGDGLYSRVELESLETEHKAANKATVNINSVIDADNYRITYSNNDVVKINSDMTQIIDASNDKLESILNYSVKKDGYGKIQITTEALKDGNVIANASTQYIYMQPNQVTFIALTGSLNWKLPI